MFESEERIYLNEENFKDFQDFFQLIPDLVCIVDKKGNFISANQAWETILGYTQDELMSGPIYNLLHPEDKESTDIATEEVFEKGGISNFINRYRRKDGDYIYLEWRARFHKGKTFATARDITQRIIYEKKLHEQSTRLENIIEGTRAGTWEWNVQTGETVFNKRWAEIIGYTL